MACVLVVDDDPHMRNGYQLVLERAGFEVAEAEGGNATLPKPIEMKTLVDSIQQRIAPRHPGMTA